MNTLLSALSEHISELRRRLIITVIAFVVTLVAGMMFAGSLFDLLIATGPAKHMMLSSFSPWDAIQAYMQIAVIIALIITTPLLLFEIWSFIKPGLTKDERRATLRYIPFASILLIAGLAFGYFIVFHLAFYFTTEVNVNMSIAQVYGVKQYFSFMINIVLPIGILFEMPVVVMFLTRIHILTPQRLRKFRRYAYMILVIIGVTVTPPDFISDFLLIIPLLSLYELSLFMSKITYRKTKGVSGYTLPASSYAYPNE